ncbi:MAG: NAD(P)-dependent oxidoreductase [Pirellulales bacterium]|nr:NAD(P)-dependent oxidoreductase [Pirellulales bacterium]
MRALITGITGFLGSHLAELMVTSGDEILGLARCHTWPDHLAQNSALRDIPLAAWDLSGTVASDVIPSATVDAIRHFRPDVIFHFAALSNPRDCGQITPNALAVQINVDGVRSIVNLAAKMPNRPRFIFASTAHVYARPTCGVRVHEESILEPSRGYGMTKLAAERVLRTIAGDQQLDLVIGRSFQHAGPRQEPRLMLAEWASQIAKNQPTPIRVHSLNTFIDVSDGRDAARAYRELAEHGRPGRVYNIGSGTRQRTGDLLEMLQAIAGTQREVIEANPGFGRNLIANIDRITSETCWRPRIPVETTLHGALVWWQSRIKSASQAKTLPPDRRELSQHYARLVDELDPKA